MCLQLAVKVLEIKTDAQASGFIREVKSGATTNSPFVMPVKQWGLEAVGVDANGVIQYLAHIGMPLALCHMLHW